MDTNIDQAAQDVRRRVEHAKGAVKSRVEELGRRLTELKDKVDLHATIAAHPWPAVGVAFALGAVMGLRKRAPAVPDEATRRSLGSAATAAVTAIAMRLGRDYVLRRVAGAAKSWIDHRKPGAASSARASSSARPVEPVFDH